MSLTSRAWSFFSREHMWRYVCFAIIVLLWAYQAIAKAWVAEDAYITFRVVDNVVNGYGLRWNIDERVQVFTNPLWLLLHVLPYAIFGNIYLVTIAISLICGLVMIGLLTQLLCCAPRVILALLTASVLIFSNSLIDFYTSGLETPMTLLLWMFFFRLLFLPFSCVSLLLVFSLAFVNRMDSVLLMFPALFLQLILHWRSVHFRHVVLGTLPAVGWCFFSLFYYGFIFPNTKYAKLSTGISPDLYFQQGVAYLYDLLIRDTTGWAMIVLAFCLGGYLAGRLLERNGLKDKRELMLLFTLCAGVMLHVVYVLCVGGDFMSGRFWVPAIFASAVIVLYYASRYVQSSWLGMALVALCILKFCNYYFYRSAIIEEPYHPQSKGIITERAYYVSATGLWSDPTTFIRKEPNYFWKDWGKLAPDDPRHTNGVAVFGNIGLYGYYAGPRLRIIDPYALTDAFLARLPIAVDAPWRIGHFLRTVPEYYVRARRNGDISAMPTNVAEYYKKLHLVVSGNLWSEERLRAIAGFQLGEYDSLIAPK